MTEFVDVIFVGEVIQVKTVPTGKFKEKKDKTGRVTFRQALLADKEVVVPPANKEFTYFDPVEMRDKRVKIEWIADDKDVYHAHYHGSPSPGVPVFIAKILDRSKNFKVKALPKTETKKDQSKN